MERDARRSPRSLSARRISRVVLTTFHGFVTLPGANGDAVSIAAQCPRRWLVVLNLQLDPRWLAEKRMK